MMVQNCFRIKYCNKIICNGLNEHTLHQPTGTFYNFEHETGIWAARALTYKMDVMLETAIQMRGLKMAKWGS